MHPDRRAHGHRRRSRLGRRDRRRRPRRRHPRATVREMDATAIDAADGHFDLAVFALSFHHLPPALASQVFAEGTRVADKLVIIDLPRPPAPLHLLRLATMLPLAPFVPFVHDGVISSLRTYSPSALRALAAHADPAIEVELRGGLDESAGGGRPRAVRLGSWAKRSRRPNTAARTAGSTGARCSCAWTSSRRCSPSRASSSSGRMTGMEIECNLVDADYQPAMSNREVLASIADPAYQTELGAYNIEFNVPPRPLPGASGARTGGRGAGQPQRRRGQGQRRRRAHRDDRHPADADARAPVGPTG